MVQIYMWKKAQTMRKRYVRVYYKVNNKVDTFELLDKYVNRDEIESLIKIKKWIFLYATYVIKE